jgi:hypothetical protein
VLLKTAAPRLSAGTSRAARTASIPQSSPHIQRDIKESDDRGADSEKNREAVVDGGLLRSLGE